MSIADKIAVMHQGVVEQIGTAIDIYERPKTRFVADFIGKANLLRGTVEDPASGLIHVSIANAIRLRVPRKSLAARGSMVELMIRSENISLRRVMSDDGPHGQIEVISYQVATAHIILQLEGGEWLSIECNGRLAAEFKPDDRVSATFDEASITVFA
jgi:ABC-type Fe3+/spermidine/putrescine transport system ATPase subunit